MASSPLRLFRHPALRGVLLGLACALIAWGVSFTELFHGLEDWMLDGCFAWRGTRPSKARIVLIGIDDDSLRALHKPYASISPELAEVVRYAHTEGAAAIGVDLLVSEDPNTPGNTAALASTEDAAKMGAAVLEAGNVVLPQHWTDSGWQRPLPQWRTRTPHVRGKAFTTDLACADLNEDRDRFIRRQQLLLRKDGEASAQFALALHVRARNHSLTWDDQGRVQIGGRYVPLDQDGMMRINYIGPPGTIPICSFKDVLADAGVRRKRPEWEGAIVIIGLTARSHRDYHATPFANSYTSWLGREEPGLMSGLELQANILATFEDEAYLRTPLLLSPLPLLLLFGLLLGWANARLEIRNSFLVAVLHHFAWKGLSLAAFTLFAWHVHLWAMMLLGMLTFAVSCVGRRPATRPEPDRGPATTADQTLDTDHAPPFAVSPSDRRKVPLEATIVPETTAPSGVPMESGPPVPVFLSPPQAPGEIGRLGGYRVLGVLGSGGMGLVFRAEDVALQRLVALKVMKPEVAVSEQSRQRFLREGRATASIEHEHVVVVYQVGEDNGVPFLAMQFLRGESLAERLQREKLLSMSEVLRIGREIALGLEAAHSRGLVHRDVKPSNLWLEGERSRVKILDFGLARPERETKPLTRSGELLGTPGYMAPEQARCQAVDGRSDLFSLGCVLYQAATGAQPFTGPDVLAILTALSVDEPVHPRQLNPLLAPALADLIMQLLAKNPATRPTSAGKVAEDLVTIEKICLSCQSLS
jgi:CHASE2 domain-containing sensor protein